MMRISQASAISAPPPSVTPFNAAITGMGRLLEGREGLVFAGQLAGNDILAHMCEFADVGTGAERLAPRARQHDRSHPLVGRNVPASGQELVESDEGVKVERRVVEGEHRDTVVLQTVVDE
jgi:hypothetical protein